MRGPDIVRTVTASFVNLSEKELLVPLRVKHDSERARGRAFKSGVEAGPGVGRQPFSENAKSVAGIELSHGGVPLRADRCIRLRRKICGVELPEKFAGGVVRETQIAVDEFLVEDRRAEKTPHLLFFYRIARDRQRVTTPGKHGARNLPIQRQEKGAATFLKRDNHLATAQLNLGRRRDAIHTAGTDSERLDHIL